MSYTINYLEVVKTYLAALEAGSTVASWNTTGNTSVMWLASFLTTHGVCTFESVITVGSEQVTSLLGNVAPFTSINPPQEDKSATPSPPRPDITTPVNC